MGHCAGDALILIAVLLLFLRVCIAIGFRLRRFLSVVHCQTYIVPKPLSVPSNISIVPHMCQCRDVLHQGDAQTSLHCARMPQ